MIMMINLTMTTGMTPIQKEQHTISTVALMLRVKWDIAMMT